MTNTAIDRYRAAKVALDTFDAFTKRMLRATREASPQHQLHLSVLTQIQTVNHQTSPSTYSDTGFNRFMADRVTTMREELAAEYRKVLVEKIKETKEEADKEAVALIREVAPE